MPRYNHSLGSSAPLKGSPRQRRKRAQYLAGWMIWLAGLNTIGQKSGRVSMTGSHFPVFLTTKSGSSSLFTQGRSKLMVITSIILFAPTMTLSSPDFTIRHNHGMFLSAKKRTPEPKVRWASKWTSPWAKIVPTTVFRMLRCGRMFSNTSFVVVTGPVQMTISDCGINSAGSSDTLCNLPSWYSPDGNFTRSFMLLNMCGLLVSSCVFTRPFVFSSKRAAQTWPLFPAAIKVTMTCSCSAPPATACGQTVSGSTPLLATWRAMRPRRSICATPPTPPAPQGR
mmetsp:Transcript_24175/g.69562  ORF Transcript_24175/g.69562 Transcript_24175/m.69562 type:complete len:282 (+) Transcript_24175:881-1726(+)